MTKLEQAARQALDFCEELATLGGKYPYVNETQVVVDARKTSSALREALAERSNHESELMMNDGNYCRKILAEQAEGAIVKTCPDGYGTITTEQAEQEPVAWGYFDADGSFMDALGKQHGAYQTPLYAAPVRTKDLTDDEIRAVWLKVIDPDGGDEVMALARAVIAADREKNK